MQELFKDNKTNINTPIERRSLNSLIANIIQFIIQFFQTILLVPLLLHFWGDEKYGVWLALFAILALFQTIDLGHQNFIGNEFNKYFHIDKVKAKELLGSSIRACLILGIFELLVLISIVYFNYTHILIGIEYNISKKYGVEWGLISVILAWILSGNIGGILVRMILPLGMMARFIYFGIILRTVHILILFFSAIFNLSIFEACIYTALSSLIYSYGIFIYIKFLMPEFYPWWTGGNWKTGLLNLRKSIIVTFNSFLDQLSSNFLILVISNYLSASYIPMFTTIRTIGNTALQGTGMFLNPLYPDMIRYHAKKEPNKLINLFEVNWIVTGFIVNTSFILSVTFIEPLYKWWTKGILNFDLALYSLIICSVIIANFSKGFNVYITSLNSLKAMTLISIFRFSIIAIISLSLIRNFKLLALGIAIFVGEIITTFLGYIFTRKNLEKLASTIDPFTLNINIVIILISNLFFFLNYYFFKNNLYFSLIFIVIILILYIILFMKLSNEVKLRIYSLFFIKFKYYIL